MRTSLHLPRFHFNLPSFTGMRQSGPQPGLILWGGCGTTKCGPFGPKKWTIWTVPLILLQKPHFWPILWLKVDLLADEGCIAPPAPLATGLVPIIGMVYRCQDLYPKIHLKMTRFFFPSTTSIQVGAYWLSWFWCGNEWNSN